jgi:preprotein translocase SecE subunit
MNGEVRKLTWLSGKELFSHTLAVVTFVLAMAAIIYLLDLAFSSGFGAISNINIG